VTATPPAPGGWSLPFAEQAASRLHDATDGVLAGALTVGAIITETPIGRFPGLMFRFQDSNGAWSKPITVLLDAHHLAQVPDLVIEATATAIRRAGGR
jgi:hypothetical protein